MKKFDIIVIGSGGGSKLTRPAARLGHSVAIIEKDALGGTCLNRGCIPSKMLIHPADVLSEVQELSKFDITMDTSFSVDFERLVTRVSDTIDRDSQQIAPMYDKIDNITYYKGQARFVGPKEIEINGEVILGNKIYISVGVRPRIPSIPGLAGTPYWTSTEALRNTQLPKSMLVIGGGYIAVELGYMYGMLGTSVTFLVRSRFIRFEDREISDEFSRVFSQRFPTHFGDKIVSVEHKDNAFIVSCETVEGERVQRRAEQVLVATGVDSNSDTLNLDSTAVEVDEAGYIRVDSYLETKEPGVYAFGDVIGRHLFRHTANYEGEYLFKTLVADHENRYPIQYPPIPHAIFTNPQVGGVGKTEDELIADGVDYVKGVTLYKNSAMGMALLSEEGFVKVLVDRTSRQLLGVHIIGKEAANMVHMAIAYMKMGATVDDMMDTIFIHPAINEIFRNAIRKAFVAVSL
jgi:mycothione reductase